MTSFNHYALGAVADWIHRTVAGLAPAAPGFRRIVVRPEPTSALSHAAARHVTPYGEAGVSWRRSESRFTLEVRVPVGVTAAVHVPGEPEPVVVAHGVHTWHTRDIWAGEPQLKPDATIREVLDHVTTWQAVVAAAVETGAALRGEPEVAERVARHLAAPASDLVDLLMPFGRPHAADELHARLDPMLDAGGSPGADD